MSSTRPQPQVHQDALLQNVLLAALVIFVPVVGHIVLTFMILRDDLPGWEKLAWILATWLLWVVGPFLYLLLGQRRDRLFTWAWGGTGTSAPSAPNAPRANPNPASTNPYNAAPYTPNPYPYGNDDPYGRTQADQERAQPESPTYPAQWPNDRRSSY